MSEPSPITTEKQPAAAAPPAATSGRDRTGKDMLLALACLFVPILLIGGLLRACGSSEPSVVNPAPAIKNARVADLFSVLAPEGLGDGWRPVQATFRRSEEGQVGTLRLGYLTPSGGQLLLVESNGDAPSLLAGELGTDVRPDGEVTVNDRTWTRSLVRGEERALVQAETGRIVIIVGRAPTEEMTELAAALR